MRPHIFRTSTAAQAKAALLAPIETPCGTLPVRHICPGDADLAQYFVASLSPAARYFRFFQMLSKLNQPLLDRFLAADGRRHVALIALAPPHQFPHIVAEARYVVSADGRDAEFAIAVADDWSRLGLARTLFGRLSAHAATAGIRRLHGHVLPDNEPMLAFARALAIEIAADPADMSVLTLSRPLAA